MPIILNSFPEHFSDTLKEHLLSADRNKTGLLDEADGSFLFLDEVHRLSAENQEKLFLFMDKGYFYRLGDNHQPCRSRVRFVFATTENTSNVLLKTFRRRIPVTVMLPSWESRPFTEQLALISHFFPTKLSAFIRTSMLIIPLFISCFLRLGAGEYWRTEEPY
ncbi:sigma 54-interacting transcriptional regulator [Klebsiella pneumoniae]